jgi:RNA polymerase sigma factor (TIGR02999 family)
VTELLRAWRAGDAQAKERLMEVLYRELHAMAHGRMRGERQTSTLQTTALVHEAYLRLLDQQRVEWRDRGHFLALAATMMRRVLVDGARSRRAVKRGSGAQPVALADLEGVGVASSPDILDVDRALERLAAAFPRPARVTELRFFGGLEIEEIGEVLGVTERTVRRDWTFARAWLARELGGEPA